LQGAANDLHVKWPDSFS